MLALFEQALMIDTNTYYVLHIFRQQRSNICRIKAMHKPTQALVGCLAGGDGMVPPLRMIIWRPQHHPMLPAKNHRLKVL